MKAPVILGMFLASCSDSLSMNAKRIHTSEGELRATADLALRSAPAGSTLLASCGSTWGPRAVIENGEEKWIEDGIKNGRFVFIKDPAGKVIYLYKDATERFINAEEDGATVRLVHTGEDGSLSLTAIYDISGVGEVIQITGENERKKVAVVATSKPAMSNGLAALPTRAGVTLADCI